MVYLINKKAQATLEFLMTYGWVIMAALIIFGVLAYFGLFSNNSGITGAAISNPPFYIDSHNIKNDAHSTSGNDAINLELNQKLGSPLSITEIEISGTDLSSGASCAWGQGPQNLNSGQNFLAELDCQYTNAFNQNDAFSGDITISYTKDSSSLVQTSSGTIKGTVE